MEGIVLSYTKILKEIKEIKVKIEEISQKDKNPKKKKTNKSGAPKGIEEQNSKMKNAPKNHGNNVSTVNTLATPVEGVGISVSDFFKNLEESI